MMRTMNGRTRSVPVFLAFAGALALTLGLLGAVRAMSVSAQDGPVGQAEILAAAAAVPGQTDSAMQPLSACQVITLQQGVDNYLGCRDTTISAEHPDENFGERELVLGMKGNARVLVAFLDLDQSIPQDAKVVEATLGVFAYNQGQRTVAMPVAAYPVVRSWRENEATWRRATSLDFWSKEGCDDTTTDRSPTPLDHTSLYGINRWYTWDVTSAAQDWVDRPAQNYGLVLIPTSTTIGGEFDIWPSEYIGPYLEVKYCLVPDVEVTKEWTEPASGAAKVGEPIAFTIRVVNTGTTTITDLTVTDIFDPQQLSFTSATIVPDTQAAGTLVWTSAALAPVLPLGPGESFTLGLQFEARSPVTFAENCVTVEGFDQHGQAVQLREACDGGQIVPPPLSGVSVSKELTYPPSGIAGVGETVTFVVRVTNTGQTAITDLEVTDTYNPTFLTLTGYSREPTTQSPGTIVWDSDALEEFLPLAGGDSFTIALEFTARQETPSTTQRVSVQGSDEYGQPVGPAHAEVDLAIERRIYQIYLPIIAKNYTVPLTCDPGCGQWDIREEFSSAADLSDWRTDNLGISDAIKVTADGWLHLSLAEPNTQFPLVWRDDLFEGTDDCFCLEVRFRHERLQRHGTTVSVNSGYYPLSGGLPRRAGQSENFRLDRIEDILSIHHNHPDEHPVQYLFEIRMIRNGDWKVVWPVAAEGRTEEHLHDITPHTARLEFDGSQYKLYVDQMQTPYGAAASALRPKSLYIGSHALQNGAWPWTDVLVDYVYVSKGRWVQSH